MTRDQIMTVAVGIVLIAATFLCPYTHRKGFPSDMREGFFPLWRRTSNAAWLSYEPDKTSYVFWPATCVAASVEIAVFAGAYFLLRPRRPGWLVWPVGLVGLTLYLVACGQPAVYFTGSFFGHGNGRSEAILGLITLKLGWFPPFTVAWAANPIWLVGMIGLLRGKDVIARNCGYAASVLGLATLVFVPPLAGYCLWQASLVCLAVAGSLGLSTANPRAKPDGAHDLA